ncbi:MAG: hypothetical protein WDN76_09675 [Alphaproteobacteria bacterium]
MSATSIVTLSTPEGFEVSFGLTPDKLQELGEALEKASRILRPARTVN